ncbi:MAG: hypothetical protein Q8M94_22595 [Ignavibacteria bacterium]|nr:hypothetical protein [Ignavibacteria bacterium]
MKIEIDKKILFQIINSHSKLAQDEYNRNPSYDNEHFSYKAETAMIEELTRLNLLDEYLANREG